jgi:hypothetical protein
LTRQYRLLPRKAAGCEVARREAEEGELVEEVIR